MQTSWERFRDATVTLAGSGSVKQRLLQAFQAHLQDFSADELPRDLRGTYSAVSAALRSAKRAGTLDTISASVLKMSEAEAGRHAQAIVSVFCGLHEAPPAARPAILLRAVPDEDIPPLINRA